MSTGDFAQTARLKSFGDGDKLVHSWGIQLHKVEKYVRERRSYVYKLSPLLPRLAGLICEFSLLFLWCLIVPDGEPFDLSVNKYNEWSFIWKMVIGNRGMLFITSSSRAFSGGKNLFVPRMQTALHSFFFDRYPNIVLEEKSANLECAMYQLLDGWHSQQVAIPAKELKRVTVTWSAT